MAYFNCKKLLRVLSKICSENYIEKSNACNDQDLVNQKFKPFKGNTQRSIMSAFVFDILMCLEVTYYKEFNTGNLPKSMYEGLDGGIS